MTARVLQRTDRAPRSGRPLSSARCRADPSQPAPDRTVVITGDCTRERHVRGRAAESLSTWTSRRLGDPRFRKILP